MTIAEIIFVILAATAILGAIGTVTLPNVVHAALFLIGSLLATAGFYILLSNEFLALVQILIYGGAVATIIIFGLMLTSGRELPSVPLGGQWPAAFVVASAMAIALLTAVVDSDWPRQTGSVTLVSVNTIAGALFRDWLLPFELVSFVLLVALIGAVVISSREKEEEV